MSLELNDISIVMADSLCRVRGVLKEAGTEEDDLDFISGVISASMVDALNRLEMERGFGVAKGFKEEDIILPKRSTACSAGYDFYSPVDVTVFPHKSAKVNTGVKAFMLPSESLEIYIRSSMGIKKHLMLSNQVALIDSDYYGNPDNDGTIILGFYNFGDEPQQIHKGDKIAQGVFRKFLDCGDVPTEKRTGGVGSTGK